MTPTAWCADWDEVAALVAAAHVHTLKSYGPDRVAGFSPIPAMSMASFASGARFMSLIGGTLRSLYDWYADLPVASSHSSLRLPPLTGAEARRRVAW